MIARRAAVNPEFPVMVHAALDRRRLLRALAAERERRHIPQQTVARSMRTSQPAVARIESGEVDVRLSTIERYAAAVGQRLRFQLDPVRPTRQVATAG
jgi:transcriptional regulator with XRE-family HTH domain